MCVCVCVRCYTTLKNTEHGNTEHNTRSTPTQQHTPREGRVTKLAVKRLWRRETLLLPLLPALCIEGISLRCIKGAATHITHVACKVLGFEQPMPHEPLLTQETEGCGGGGDRVLWRMR